MGSAQPHTDGLLLHNIFDVASQVESEFVSFIY